MLIEHCTNQQRMTPHYKANHKVWHFIRPKAKAIATLSLFHSVWLVSPRLFGYTARATQDARLWVLRCRGGQGLRPSRHQGERDHDLGAGVGLTRGPGESLKRTGETWHRSEVEDRVQRSVAWGQSISIFSAFWLNTWVSLYFIWDAKDLVFLLSLGSEISSWAAAGVFGTRWIFGQ